MRALTALLLFLSLSASAQAGPPVQLTGSTLDGQPFSLAALRGKVVMLFFWNTDCVPCVQKMPELRANAAGWRGKPFELVLVSTDRERAAALGYLQTLRQVEPNGSALPALWAGDLRWTAPLAAPAAVPLTLVIDAKGAIVTRHAGRIAPEAWDEVADLLP
ncbi:TlpA family protein disulfide reductase [Pelomonas sp. HMWF004]|nr:TlpA family protein disulfide reductase [Pelomonas sp. HMWF004]